MKPSQLIGAAILFVAVPILVSLAYGQRDELRDTKIKLSGLAALESALQQENRWLRDEVRRSDSLRRSDSTRAAADLKRVNGKLATIVARAAALGADTVWVPVSTIAEADTAITSCTEARLSCEASRSAEQRLRVNVEQERDAAVAEAGLARKLIPTPAQRFRHDAKVVGLTAAVVVTLLTFLNAVTP